MTKMMVTISKSLSNMHKLSIICTKYSRSIHVSPKLKHIGSKEKGPPT